MHRCKPAQVQQCLYAQLPVVCCSARALGCNHKLVCRAREQCSRRHEATPTCCHACVTSAPRSTATRSRIHPKRRCHCTFGMWQGKASALSTALPGHIQQRWACHEQCLQKCKPLGEFGADLLQGSLRQSHCHVSTEQ